jgi:hypothetical protein
MAINHSIVPSDETEIGPVTNSGAELIALSEPYIVRAVLVGVSDLLFHRWNVEGVEAKSRAAKGSKAKKTDDLESYVYRNDVGQLCVPGEYVRQAIIHAAKFRQDPRSPRKSAMDLFKAGVVTLTMLAPVNANGEPVQAKPQAWDYEHRCRVMVQRDGITRTRPAMKTGWTITVDVLVNLPEYIPVDVLHDVFVNAGRLIGIGDFRPSYGRFAIARFEGLQA